MKTKLAFLFIFVYSFFFSQKRDSLHIPFPEKYHLVLKHHQENEKLDFKEWIPENETFDNYTIIVTFVTLKGGHQVSIKDYKDSLFKSFQEATKGARFTELARNKEGEKEYLIFKGEVDSYIKKPDTNEAQIYFLIKGEKDFFSGIVALKKKTLPQSFIKEWIKVFQNSKFIK